MAWLTVARWSHFLSSIDGIHWTDKENSPGNVTDELSTFRFGFLGHCKDVVQEKHAKVNYLDSQRFNEPQIIKNRKRGWINCEKKGLMM